jgi:hypothetical protein
VDYYLCTQFVVSCQSLFTNRPEKVYRKYPSGSYCMKIFFFFFFQFLILCQQEKAVADASNFGYSIVSCRRRNFFGQNTVAEVSFSDERKKTKAVADVSFG